jgi:hydrogenase expression/formation protein HypD
MKHIDEYRDMALVRKLSASIRAEATGEYTFMEVCGGHTNAIRRFGIHSLLPENIRLVSGPGCPVCVTDRSFIDRAVSCSAEKGTIIATFGDLMRVTGSKSSLEKEKSSGADIRVVFSPLEALDIAKENRRIRVVFLGIGFETTVPGTAVTIKMADGEGIDNFYLLSAHKIMPPAMEAIIKEGIKISGFICPGHVAAITGSAAFGFIPERFGIGCAISGFEPVDILQSVYMLVKQVNERQPQTEIQYRRVVTPGGNKLAQNEMQDVFGICDVPWRGLGLIRESGLRLNDRFERFDIGKNLQVSYGESDENERCLCGEILRGLKTPQDCPLFAGACIPSDPAGACMVSAEGACNIYYKYRFNV